ncbi:hypothetical protein [Salinibaculum rarum]|uniref:hypothetical protein n=1 Tax=Salinibaculum rarum TaxID=3058903 RepID=UPI00265D6939|nr:hypothetical protein [Salinibaculum sp. KK48]
MPSLADYFPWYAWVAVLSLGAVAVVPFFFSPERGMAVGLSLVEYLAVVAVVEFAAAAGIGALVVHYRDTDREEREWRFEP